MANPQLILIRGDAREGSAYALNDGETTLGRSAAAIQFPTDPTLAPAHCAFDGKGGIVWVRDLGTTNGVFVRITSPSVLNDGHIFRIGEQVFRVERVKPQAVTIGLDGAIFGGSPVSEARFRLIQFFAGGVRGLVKAVTAPTCSLGRGGCDLNFPDDRYLSHEHARLEDRHRQIVITDLKSRNGVFVRLMAPSQVPDGAELFIGHQLVRVVNPA